MQPTIGRILLVREMELVKDEDGKQRYEVRSVRPGIVLAVNDEDGSVDVQIFDRPTYSGLPVHADRAALGQADADADKKGPRNRDGLCAYWPDRAAETPPSE